MRQACFTTIGVNYLTIDLKKVGGLREKTWA
jgi:hypothetical protein